MSDSVQIKLANITIPGKEYGDKLTNEEALSYIISVSTKRSDLTPKTGISSLFSSFKSVNTNDYANISDDAKKVEAIAADQIEKAGDKGVTKFVAPTIKNSDGEELTLTSDDISFTAGSVILNIAQPQNFVPGVYSITVDVTNPITGEVTSFTQDFVW